MILKDAMKKLGGFFVQHAFFMQDIPPEIIDFSTGDQLGFQRILSAQTHLMDVMGHSRSFNEDGSSTFMIEINKIKLPFNIVPVKCKPVKWSQRLLQTNEDDGRLLNVVGCLPKLDMDILKFNLQPTHVVCAKDENPLALFLKELSQCNACAILRTKYLDLAVLFPCTSEIATLSVLNYQRKNELKLTVALTTQKSLQETISKTSTEISKMIKKEKIYRSECLNSWYTPGSSTYLTDTLNTVCERVQKKKEGSNVNDVLKELSRFYAREKQPKELIHDIVPTNTSTPLCGPFNRRTSNSGGSDTNATSGHRSRLSRGHMMVNRAKSASNLTMEESSLFSQQGCSERKTSESFTASAGISDISVNTESDLIQFLEKQCMEVVNEGTAAETSVHTMMSVATRLMADLHVSNPQKAAVEFIRENAALTSTALREKYLLSDKDVTYKISEYKLQILLLLEMESLSLDETHDSSVTLSEVVAMLRAITFAMGPVGLQEFLKDTVIQNYKTNLGQMLVNVYDELMLPIPSTLEQFASPSAPTSVWGPLSSVGEDSQLSGPGSSQPGSNLSDQLRKTRSGKLKAIPSFSDFSQKRQILVKPKIEPKVVKSNIKKSVRKSSRKRESKSRSRSARRRTEGSVNVETDKARKNLFGNTTPKTSKVKKRSKSESIHRRSSSKTGKSKVLVPGTPSHKQSASSLRARQERRRQRHNIKTDICVVAESPIKEDGAPMAMLDKPAQYLVREAFYSANSQQSRNLAKSMELSQSSTQPSVSATLYGSQTQRLQGSLASAVRGESPFLSPGRRLRSLLASPSPDRRSRNSRSILASPSPDYRMRQTRSSLASPDHLLGTSSPSTPRRSPRKPVKKLDFKDCFSNTRKTRTSAASHDAHLIFDGENASDTTFKSPSKNFVLKSPFKTPEKGKFGVRHLSMDAASCPPILAGTPPQRSRSELNFKNVLSAQSEAKFRVGSPKGKQSATFSSPDWASRFSSNMNLRSPAKQSSLLSDFKKTCSFDTKIPENSIKIPQGIESFRLDSPNRDSIKRSETFVSTPEKLSSRHQARLFSTPTKVTFSPSKTIFPNKNFLSPNAHNSPTLTPVKSILKTPGKASRRIELTPVTANDSKRNSFMDKLKEASFNIVENENLSINNQFTDVKSTLGSVPSQNKMARDLTSLFDSHANQKGSLSSEEDGSSDLFSRNSPIKIKTPPPSSKPKTPDSINKWNRRKRLSGARYSPSREEENTKSLSQTSFSQDNLKVKIEQSRKRNFDNLDDQVSESPRKRAKRNLNVKEKSVSSKENFQREGTGDFTPIVGKGLNVSLDDSEELPMRTSVREHLFTESEDQSQSQPVYSTIRSSSCEWIEVSSQSGSQGFPISHPEGVLPTDSDGADHPCSSKTKQESPIIPSISPSTKKVYSPSLTASGLMHLMKSPIISKTDKSRNQNERFKSKMRSNSRKHLQLD